MKQVCLLCNRISPDNNLYCQEVYCPAEMSPIILDQGEWLGDIEIVKPIIILRSSVLYEAIHQKKQVYLKVAHPGEENKERLKREAEFLQKQHDSKTPHPFLPVLRPPYANTTVANDAYGKAMLSEHLLYFCLFNHFEGEPLRDILTKHPQLWINHVGWLTISLASAVAFLNSQGFFHYGLSPEVVLVRFDDDPNVPRILLFDLGVISNGQSLSRNWFPFTTLPAYTAPELIDEQMIHPDYATDVYGLGLILYELLVGESPFPFKLNGDAEVYQAVQKNRRVRMNRVEDVKTVADIASQAVNLQPELRQPDAKTLHDQLVEHFRHVPPAKKSRWPSLNTMLVVVGALLTIAFLITLVVSVAEFAS